MYSLKVAAAKTPVQYPSRADSIGAVAQAIRDLERSNAAHDPGVRSLRGPRGEDAYTFFRYAVHESGHAVAGLVLWPPLQCVRSIHLDIDGTRNWSGLCRIDDPPDAHPFNRGVVSAAGPIADRQYQATYGFRCHRPDGTQGDRDDIARLLGFAFPDATWWNIEEKAREIVCEYWRPITAVAQALSARGQLSGDEFQRIAFANW